MKENCYYCKEERNVTAMLNAGNRVCSNCKRDLSENHNKLISDEFKEKFGYAGSSGTFQGVRDDEIIKWITAQQTAHEADLRKAIEDTTREILKTISTWSFTEKEHVIAIESILQTLSNKDVI